MEVAVDRSARRASFLQTKMKRYLLNIYQPDGGKPPREILETIMRNVAALRSEMQDAGAWLSTVGLQPAAQAAVVRPRGENGLVTDGPFVESKEHIGGLVMIQAADREAALGWARKLTRATTLPVELREIRDENQG